MADIRKNLGEDTVLLPQTSAPSVVTDKMYNVGGNLFWNGIDISTTPAATTLIDADGDTSVNVETAADDDRIRFNTGSQDGSVINGYPANTDTMIIGSAGVSISLPQSNVDGTFGGSISPAQSGKRL